jgi:hypothetical protein
MPEDWKQMDPSWTDRLADRSASLPVDHPFILHPGEKAAARSI